MKQFTSLADAGDTTLLIREALSLKKDPHAFSSLGKNKTLGLIFMNPSFRTRLSTQKAAQLLGMHVIVMNIHQDGWKLEMQDGAVMNGDSAEHIKDAAAVMGLYCDIIGLRSFPGLKSREADYGEEILNSFLRHCGKPLISLESGTRHPLQSLADRISIHESWTGPGKPKVVLCWAPHIKALPQAVPNSFAEWMRHDTEIDFSICHPEGYELCETFAGESPVSHDPAEGLRDADFVYLKNWSSYQNYGSMPPVQNNWLLDEAALKISNNARIMHCLPVRRNVEVLDSLLDGSNSLIMKQAENRVYAAQAVLKQILQAQI